MPAGPTLSGTQGKMHKVGTPDVEIEFGKWTVTEDVDTDRYATSLTGGYKATEPGNKSATGTLEGKRTTDATKIEALLTIGEKATLKCGFDSTTGIEMPVVIKSRTFEVNPADGTVETFSMTFESDGEWTYY